MRYSYILFPIFDHLYIYQLLEYEPLDFIKWFLKNPLKRNLQKKNKLVFSNKVKLFFAVSFFLYILSVLFLYNLTYRGSFLGLVLWLLVLPIFSPVFILFAQFLIQPLEEYQKQKILNAAKRKLQKHPNLKVIAIVGSFAKTSTKNMLYTLLWKDFLVVKTPKSFNTPISIARTVLSDIKETTQIFIVEMDAYHQGEIKALAKLVNPELGIITSIAPQHLERFGSMEKLAKTQFELAESLDKSGTLFLNSTNRWILDLEKGYSVKKIFYGEREEDEIRIDHISQTQNDISFRMIINHQPLNISLPILGKHNALNFASAASVANKLGLDLKTIQKRASLILATEHRLEVKKVGNLKLIDNTYNTNPIVGKSSLKLLSDLKGSQKILITPGFIELGDEAFSKNKEFMIEASKIADIIIIVGQTNKKALEEGLVLGGFNQSNLHFASDTKKALQLLTKIAKKDAIVLLENDLPDQYD